MMICQVPVLQALRDDAELRRKQEIHEAEESKNAHIQDLMKKHEKASPAYVLLIFNSSSFLTASY